MRSVTADDFKNTDIISARYEGNSKHLIKGTKYNIKFIEKRKKISVSLRNNPHLGKSNCGVEFGLKSFFIE